MWYLKIIRIKNTLKNSRHHDWEVRTKDLKACLMKLFYI